MDKRITVGVIVLFCLIAVGIGFKMQSPQKQISSFPQINIATMPHSFSGYTIFLAKEKKYFKSQGLDVRIIKTYPHGKATLNALNTGEAQIAASSETPFINSILNGDKINTIAITISAEDHLAIVARKDSKILNVKDLMNKKIGVTLGSNGEYFLDMVLTLNGLGRKDIQTIDLKPNQMVEKLLTKEVDAIATWNPEKYKAIKELDENAVIFNAENLYSPLFIVAATKDFAASNPEILKKLLKSLLSATQFIKENPEQAHQIVAKEIGADVTVLNELAASYHFTLSLEQSFLTTLENETVWALKNNGDAVQKMPDYLDYIYLDALEDVNPKGITIIR